MVLCRCQDVNIRLFPRAARCRRPPRYGADTECQSSYRAQFTPREIRDAGGSCFRPDPPKTVWGAFGALMGILLLNVRECYGTTLVPEKLAVRFQM
jgi:hypothetical protein